MQRQLPSLTPATNPILATVVSVLAIILGILVILYPALLAWLVGIGLALAGVALLAAAWRGGSSSRS